MILKIEEKPLTYLKTYQIHYTDKFGQPKVWEMVSRQGQDRLYDEITHHTHHTDGSMIIAYNEDKTNVILVKEYRPVAGRYIYALPAGLSDAEESVETTAIREFKEETGLDLKVEGVDGPRYTSVGLSNERIHAVFGTYSGIISQDFLDGSEDIEALIVDREEAIRILAEEEVPVRTALILMKLFDIPFF